jgi:AcrR family transcriptional regulator
MPRANTPEERERIRQRLLETGREAFSRAGLAKVTIAELAREAGIGKGSFYSFFDSKEELFLAIQEREEAAFKKVLVRKTEQAGSPREAVTTLLLAVATGLDDHPFLRLLLDPRTLKELLVRLPPERMAGHRKDDQDFFFSLAQDWKQRGWLHDEVELQTVFDVLTAMFVISVQRELMGKEASRRATAELAAAIACRWCP